LQGRLPAYMVPEIYVVHARFPLTASGKVDRQRLAMPASTREFARVTEEAVARLWTAVLRREVSPDDDFFASGGDSLTAIHLFLAAEDTFGVAPPRDAVWENFNVRSFTALMKGVTAVVGSSNVPHSSGYGRLPLSLAQKRYWMRLAAGEPPQSFHVAQCYQVDGEVDVSRLHDALKGIMQRHDSMRTGFLSGETGPAMSIRAAVPCPFSVVDCRGAGEQELERICREEASRTFDVSIPPLCRFRLFTTGPKTHRVLTVFHHLITDGWSRGVFERDVNALYRGGGWEGAAADSERASYADFVWWEQNSFLTSGERRRHLSFWREMLERVPLEPCAIPTDVATKQLDSRSGSAALVLDAELAEQLRQVAAVERCSFFAVLIAIFKTVLFSYSGQASIAITTDSANRREVRWRRVHGLFANVLVLRTTNARTRSFREVLGCTHATLRNAIQADLPFADLMEELFPGQLARYDEMFPVAVLFENTEPEPAEGLLRNPVEVECGSVSRPLLITFQAAAGGVTVVASYRKNRFSPERVNEILQRFQGLAHTIAGDANGRIGDLIRAANPRA
jgi:acyl carrier protein